MLCTGRRRALYQARVIHRRNVQMFFKLLLFSVDGGLAGIDVIRSERILPVRVLQAELGLRREEVDQLDVDVAACRNEYQ